LIRDACVEKQGQIMICGNKNTLGKAIIEGLTTQNQVLTQQEYEEIKLQGRIMVELWNE